MHEEEYVRKSKCAILGTCEVKQRDRFNISKETKLRCKTQPNLSTTQSTEYGNMKMRLSSSDNKLFRRFLREYIQGYS